MRGGLQSVWHGGKLHYQGVGGSPLSLHTRFTGCGFYAEELPNILVNTRVLEETEENKKTLKIVMFDSQESSQ